jgi:hypothetical protein
MSRSLPERQEAHAQRDKSAPFRFKHNFSGEAFLIKPAPFLATHENWDLDMPPRSAAARAQWWRRPPAALWA